MFELSDIEEESAGTSQDIQLTKEELDQFVEKVRILIQKAFEITEFRI